MRQLWVFSRNLFRQTLANHGHAASRKKLIRLRPPTSQMMHFYSATLFSPLFLVRLSCWEARRNSSTAVVVSLTRLNQHLHTPTRCVWLESKHYSYLRFTARALFANQHNFRLHQLTHLFHRQRKFRCYVSSHPQLTDTRQT